MSNIDRNARLVDLRNVTRTFPTEQGGFTAVDRVDFSIEAGEFVAIVGKSGSGKSTLVNLVAGIDRPTAGTVQVAGVRLDTLGESDLAAWRGRTVGVVFQFFQLLPTLTILENVMLPMDFCGTLPRREARARALELLDLVGVADQASKIPSALSGGQQQRAAIARALANDPPLIVADEPTGNLDSHTAGAVLELLGRLTRTGKTVLMVTHERDMSQTIDRTVTIVDGKIAGETAGGPEAAATEVVAHV
ncbi:MAG TPA: ABC transporter ATP-binding protein [Polyangiaceae bacterium]|nr:ABC transporter ATP-binding protein [Polyangiaceae bacterium]